MIDPYRPLRGIYVHVPFCTRRCYYCDFNTYTLDRRAVVTYLDALAKEIELVRSELDKQGAIQDGDKGAFDTLFIGGGTPTCLSGKDLKTLVGRVKDAFPLKVDAEITSEANPGSSNTDKFKSLREAGVNRLSLGVQSFDDGLLSRLGRTHTATEAVQAFEAAREAGFDNINLDLMFALPGQTKAMWKKSLLRTVQLAPEHISCYSLIVEDGTPFGRAYEKGRLTLPDEDDEYDMYQAAIDLLGEAGYELYEISNFARAERRSLHNSIYWRNDDYLAFGPGAHGSWQGVRYANIRLPSDYAKKLETGQRPFEFVQTTEPSEQMDDTMIFGLRMTDGVLRADFKARFGRDVKEVYPEQIDSLQDLGLLEVTDRVVRLSRKGLPIANQVFAEFLRV